MERTQLVYASQLFSPYSNFPKDSSQKSTISRDDDKNRILRRRRRRRVI
jgi:hypothetical protein